MNVQTNSDKYDYLRYQLAGLTNQFLLDFVENYGGVPDQLYVIERIVGWYTVVEYTVEAIRYDHGLVIKSNPTRGDVRQLAQLVKSQEFSSDKIYLDCSGPNTEIELPSYRLTDVGKDGISAWSPDSLHDLARRMNAIFTDGGHSEQEGSGQRPNG